VKYLSEEIHQCLQRAGDCARKAAAESDPKIKAAFLDTKRRWTALARNYEFANGLPTGRNRTTNCLRCERRTNEVYALPTLPPPWSIEDIGAASVVRHAHGRGLAYIYYEDEPGRRWTAKLLTKDETRRIAANIAKLPGLAALSPTH
jgi:hypothetical protein